LNVIRTDPSLEGAVAVRWKVHGSPFESKFTPQYMAVVPAPLEKSAKSA
jgi:hypothetical protein